MGKIDFLKTIKYYEQMDVVFFSHCWNSLLSIKKTVIHYYSIHTVVVYTCLNSQQNFTTRNKYNATWQSSGLIQQAVQNNGAIVYNHGFKVLFIKSSVNANFVSVIMSVGCWNNFVICSETWKSLLEHVLLSYVDNSRHTILCL